ncbi:DinB family protein [Pseudonocardia sp.]|uniref:DinB family protein n=1 Tax=Pseudonocardia sp. TaxID=60912 RepID=UPI003D1132BE
MDVKAHLHAALRAGREAVVWKLDGLSEYDARRPLLPSGTNLVGLVKHLAGVEAGYFGSTFGRPFPEHLPWFADDAQPEDDMWARPGESRDDLVALYRRVWAHADATIEALGLDARGEVPHWPEPRRHVTLGQVLVHVVAETHRHAGHADAVRELVDGAAGRHPGDPNAPADTGHRDRVEAAARALRPG